MKMKLFVKTYRELTRDELYAILELRVSVFVVEQNCAYQELDGCDPEALHVWLEDEEGIAAYLRILDRGVKSEYVTIGRVIAKDYGHVIERCVSIKKSIVEADERDTGIRQLLNFGHTIGHSIEKLSSYTIPHGVAVAKGMVFESRAAFRMGLTDYDASDYLREILTDIGFVLSIPYTVDELYKYALNDKKIRGSSIAMVIPEQCGKCRLHKISLDSLHTFIELGMDDAPL